MYNQASVNIFHFHELPDLKVMITLGKKLNYKLCILSAGVITQIDCKHVSLSSRLKAAAVVHEGVLSRRNVSFQHWKCDFKHRPQTPAPYFAPSPMAEAYSSINLQPSVACNGGRHRSVALYHCTREIRIEGSEILPDIKALGKFKLLMIIRRRYLIRYSWLCPDSRSKSSLVKQKSNFNCPKWEMMPSTLRSMAKVLHKILKYSMRFNPCARRRTGLLKLSTSSRTMICYVHENKNAPGGSRGEAARYLNTLPQHHKYHPPTLQATH